MGLVIGSFRRYMGKGGKTKWIGRWKCTNSACDGEGTSRNVYFKRVGPKLQLVCDKCYFPVHQLDKEQENGRIQDN